MKIADIVPLGDGVYEIEKGLGDRALGNSGAAKLLLAGIVASCSPRKLNQSDDVL